MACTAFETCEGKEEVKERKKEKKKASEQTTDRAKLPQHQTKAIYICLRTIGVDGDVFVRPCAQNFGRRVFDVAFEMMADNALVPVQREAKVGDFDGEIVGDEQVGELEIAMNDVVGVQPVEAGNNVFGQFQTLRQRSICRLLRKRKGHKERNDTHLTSFNVSFKFPRPAYSVTMAT